MSARHGMANRKKIVITREMSRLGLCVIFSHRLPLFFLHIFSIYNDGRLQNQVF